MDTLHTLDGSLSVPGLHCLTALNPLLGDAVDVAGIQEHFPGSHAHHLVVRAVRLLQRLNGHHVCLCCCACARGIVSDKDFGQVSIDGATP